MTTTARMVTITVDGERMEAPAGVSLLEWAKRQGIYIPHFCYLEGLPPYAGCRMCLVEFLVQTPQGEQWRADLACTTTIRPDMVVRTRSENLFKQQQGVLGLIISDHPDRCLTCHRVLHCPPDYICLRDVGSPYRCATCAKNRRCDLQSTTEYLKMHEHDLYYKEDRHFYWWKWQKEEQLPIDRANPFLERDYNECIVCARCIRICDDVRDQGVYDLLYRGPKAQVGTALGLPLHESGCEFCGACVDVCPVNTLMDKRTKWGGAAERQVSTICSYCSVGCQIVLDIKRERIQRAIPDPLGPVNGREALPGGYGHVCVLGRYGHDFVHSRERLTAPLLRRDGVLVEATWEEALQYLAERLPAYKGPAFAAIAGGQVTNEEAYLLQKFARAVMSSNNVDHIGRYEQALGTEVLTEALGLGAATHPFSHLSQARCILAIGTNATVSNPVAALFIRLAAKAGVPLVLINPRETELARRAAVWLRPRPGTDALLLAAMARVLLDEGLADEAFLTEHAERLEEFKASLARVTLEEAEQVTGVPATEIAAAARLYAAHRPAAIVFGMGITQQAKARQAIAGLVNLALLTGNVGPQGGGIYPLRIHANTQGATDMGLVPDRLPGYASLDDAGARRRFEELWRCALPAEPGRTLPQIIAAAKEGSVKALFVLGENLLLSHPDPEEARAALQRAELVVVSDLFLTETAELAHVVLPAAAPQELDGTYTNGERRVQRLHQALQPPEEARPAFRVLAELAQRLGAPGFDYAHPSRVFAEIAALVPAYAGLSYLRLDFGGVQWPCPQPDHPGTPILFAEGFPTGRARFLPLDNDLSAPPPADGAFYLLVERNRYQQHTGDQTRRTPGLVWFYPEDRAEISPLDAASLGLSEGDRVRIVSSTGEAVVRAHITDSSPPRVIALTTHYPDTAGRLLAAALADGRDTVPLKGLFVRVEKA